MNSGLIFFILTFLVLLRLLSERLSFLVLVWRPSDQFCWVIIIKLFFLHLSDRPLIIQIDGIIRLLEPISFVQLLLQPSSWCYIGLWHWIQCFMGSNIWILINWETCRRLRSWSSFLLYNSILLSHFLFLKVWYNLVFIRTEHNWLHLLPLRWRWENNNLSMCPSVVPLLLDNLDIWVQSHLMLLISLGNIGPLRVVSAAWSLGLLSDGFQLIDTSLLFILNGHAILRIQI